MLEFATPERAQTPPPSHGIDWTTIVTPKRNLAEIRRFTDYINGRIIDDTFNYLPLTLLIRERAEKKRTKNANRVVQKYEVLEAGAARLRIAERNKWEESKAEIDSKRREEVEIKRMQKWYRAIRSEAWKKNGQWLARQRWRKAYTKCLPELLLKTNMILSRIS
ncbi:hypothetical protein K3495_g15803 [Podosphaera aphanis]|nr:hypothetical protein K3495_g15803 [Podosphaera aphanis]